ncbi:DarT ssDNA thymidine ADP-ribosyltransferase family protein [Lactiplantibacillus sp. WILCCON 0030]|uniref:DarT ssDNA thymidine ADP-ribosyltransferase family protein n=1 Tax=Lactiplantibacillus brownii TaxID=3069269 RepID=A0ABU1AEG7_9LACO|nr:DarT ssDNA thymidine ADP-ribosyltransferase family protein [Lactiplantibacillus brownii]MDQ7938600.1 DarT ssDNA thymidine ADP-ribosyltransferase family protein [Lactiplantibacillus brownii]
MTYSDIVAELLNGTKTTNLNPAKRRYWPRFAFHFTDSDNVIDILKRGSLISRAYAEQNGVMANDNASNEVIDQTESEIKKMVRLYFRPRTPTQFYNEGFQTKYKRERKPYNANCPVPVFFLFDMVGLLNLPATKFSNRSLASKNVPLFNTPEAFNNLPFEQIYHDSSFNGLDYTQKKTITHHKHAEIVVPDELDLKLLKFIYVRSIAEKTMLLAELHEVGIFKYDAMIQIGDESTFYMDRNFIQNVSLDSTKFTLKCSVQDSYPSDWGHVQYAINPDSVDRYLNVSIKSVTPTGRTVIWPKPGYKALLNTTMPFILNRPESSYKLEVRIDGHLAYLGEYDQTKDELPF